MFGVLVAGRVCRIEAIDIRQQDQCDLRAKKLMPTVPNFPAAEA